MSYDATGALSVLVVEDDDALREAVVAALEDEGYAVLAAPNGLAALDVVARSAPLAILLDMRMPIMDGWEFARAYRERPGPHAPIIVFTAARDAGRWAAEIDADAYLAKPFNLNDLLALVERYAGAPA